MNFEQWWCDYRAEHLSYTGRSVIPNMYAIAKDAYAAGQAAQREVFRDVPYRFADVADVIDECIAKGNPITVQGFLRASAERYTAAIRQQG